jgi:hypothetical protein
MSLPLTFTHLSATFALHLSITYNTFHPFVQTVSFKMSKQGVFLDVVGLSYRCGTIKDATDVDCAFHYEPGALVIFSIGTLVIGESIGTPLLTISDLVPANTPTSDPKLINRARLLYSLTQAQGFETPVTIDTDVSSLWTTNFPPQWLTDCHYAITGPQHCNKVCSTDQSRQSEWVRYGSGSLQNLWGTEYFS